MHTTGRFQAKGPGALRVHRAFAALSALCASGLVAAGAAAAQDLPADAVKIAQVDYHGTGCAAGSVALDVASDGQAMTMLFSDYVVDTSTQAGRPARKSCVLDLTLSVPSGWSFGLLGTQVRGYVTLQQGAMAEQQATAQFDHGHPQVLGDHIAKGVFDGDYDDASELAFTTVNWSPCTNAATQNVAVSTFLSVRPTTSFRSDQGEVDNPQLGHGFPEGMITVDSLDNAIGHVYTFAWKRCDDDSHPGEPLQVAATCRIQAGGRSYEERSAGGDPAASRAAALARVLDSCRRDNHAGTGANSCQAGHVICSYVSQRQPPGQALARKNR